jgi:hypothetical protein
MPEVLFRTKNYEIADTRFREYSEKRIVANRDATKVPTARLSFDNCRPVGISGSTNVTSERSEEGDGSEGPTAPQLGLMSLMLMKASGIRNVMFGPPSKTKDGVG